MLLCVMFSRRKKNRSLNFTYFEKKISGKHGRLKIARKKIAILIGEFFPLFLKSGNNGRYCISIRRRSVTNRGSLQKRKNQVYELAHIQKKISGTSGRLKNCAKKTWKLWGESSPIRMTLKNRTYGTSTHNNLYITLLILPLPCIARPRATFASSYRYR